MWLWIVWWQIFDWGNCICSWGWAFPLWLATILMMFLNGVVQMCVQVRYSLLLLFQHKNWHLINGWGWCGLVEEENNLYFGYIFKNRWFLSLGFILNQFWDIWEFLDPWREVSLERPPLGSSVHCWDWNVNQERDSESGDRRNTTWKQSQPGTSGVLLPNTDHLLSKIRCFSSES